MAALSASCFRDFENLSRFLTKTRTGTRVRETAVRHFFYSVAVAIAPDASSLYFRFKTLFVRAEMIIMYSSHKAPFPNTS